MVETIPLDLKDALACFLSWHAWYKWYFSFFMLGRLITRLFQDSLEIKFMLAWPKCQCHMLVYVLDPMWFDARFCIYFIMNTNQITLISLSIQDFIVHDICFNYEIKSKRIWIMHIKFVMEITNCEIKIIHYGSILGTSQVDV